MGKLGKHIKKTIEERRIAPSPQAWEKISSRIGAEQKKSVNKWRIYAIAASFIGITVISIFLFKMRTPIETTPRAVDIQNQQEESLQPDKYNQIPLEVEHNHTQMIIADVEKAPIKDSSTVESVSMNVQKTILDVENYALEDGVLNNSEVLIAQKINEVAEQVALLETMNNNVSDAEVDSLLRAAQRQILSERIFDSEKVDAMALLTEVEDELDDSFRDQIFEALKDGYLKLRTAVADRNN